MRVLDGFEWDRANAQMNIRIISEAGGKFVMR